MLVGMEIASSTTSTGLATTRIYCTLSAKMSAFGVAKLTDMITSFIPVYVSQSFALTSSDFK